MPESECIDLLSANAAQLEQFKQAVTVLRGYLPLIVHGFYTDGVEDSTGLGFHTTSDYRPRRDRFIKGILSRGYPLGIMEQGDDIDLLEQRIAALDGGTVYTVATKQASHQLPIARDWDRLISIFRMGGVRTLIVGGVYLMKLPTQEAWEKHGSPWLKEVIDSKQKYMEVNPLAAKWLKDDLIPVGCAGSAAVHFLTSNFDVVLSKVSTPG